MLQQMAPNNRLSVSTLNYNEECLTKMASRGETDYLSFHRQN
jgi:hypothetical protein